MEQLVTITIEDGVADVRLSRPDKMNALNREMFEAIAETGERLKADRSVRAVVLSGEGRGFCAGLDRSRFVAIGSGDGQEAEIDLLRGQRTPGGANHAQQPVMVWREIEAPVIAAVHGVAVGGGFQLALGCDLRFVTPDAQLSAMEIKWGLVPDMGGIALLRTLMRDDQARELLWSGRMVSGEEALNLGLATRVCADPRAEALAFAREIAGRNPQAIRAGKRLMNLAADADRRAILLRESVEQSALVGSPNMIEAIRANLENRPPQFTD